MRRAASRALCQGPCRARSLPRHPASSPIGSHPRWPGRDRAAARGLRRCCLRCRVPFRAGNCWLTHRRTPPCAEGMPRPAGGGRSSGPVDGGIRRCDSSGKSRTFGWLRLAGGRIMPRLEIHQRGRGGANAATSDWYNSGYTGSARRLSLASAAPPPGSRGPVRAGRVPYVVAPAVGAPSAAEATPGAPVPRHLRRRRAGGSVERVTFANEESGFAGLAGPAADGQELPRRTVVGKLAAVHIGEQVRLHGRWTTHAQHGRQFEGAGFRGGAAHHRRGHSEVPRLGADPRRRQGHRRAAGASLRRGDAGDHRAAPGRLEGKAGGIGPTRARAIRAAWQEQKAIKEVMVFLASHDVSTTLGLNIYRQYGDESVQVIRETPYKLARDVAASASRLLEIAANLGMAPDPSTVRWRARPRAGRGDQRGPRRICPSVSTRAGRGDAGPARGAPAGGSDGAGRRGRDRDRGEDWV